MQICVYAEQKEKKSHILKSISARKTKFSEKAADISNKTSLKI
jgi:hypothetical protein